MVVGGTQIPEADRAVFTGGGDLPAVAPNRDRENPRHVTLEGTHLLRGGHFPYANGFVFAAGDEELAVGVNDEVGDGADVAREFAESGGGVSSAGAIGSGPRGEAGLRVLAAGVDRAVIGGEGDAVALAATGTVDHSGGHGHAVADAGRVDGRESEVVRDADELAVGAVGHAFDAGVSRSAAERVLTRLGFEHPQDSIVASDRDRLPIRAKGETLERLVGLLDGGEHLDLLARVRFPEVELRAAH